MNPVFPLWLKLAVTAWTAVLIPFYWVHLGPVNFLWFSDIALFGVVIALWLGHRLIASMMAVAVLLPEVVWNIDYFGRLLTGHGMAGLTGYMFEDESPLFVRGLSLFHVFLPPVLAWMVYRLGYDRRALPATTVLAWVVLPATWLLAPADRNINWVHPFGELTEGLLPGASHVLALMVLLPLVIYVPTHWLLARYVAPAGGLTSHPR